MSDLIGRFLSFEERMGRDLVRFAYYVGLFYLVVLSLFGLIGHLFAMEIGQFLLVPFKFLLWLLVLRVVAEVAMAILSMEEQMNPAGASGDGFEAGLTPPPGAGSPDPAGASSAPAPETTIESGDQPAATGTSASGGADGTADDGAKPTATKKTAAKRTTRKSTKKATKKATKSADTPAEKVDGDGASTTAEGHSTAQDADAAPATDTDNGENDPAAADAPKTGSAG